MCVTFTTQDSKFTSKEVESHCRVYVPSYWVDSEYLGRDWLVEVVDLRCHIISVSAK